MKSKIQNITTIQTGVYEKTSKSGNFVYLQAKHFDEAGNLVEELFKDLPYNDKLDRHILHPGDVLFAAKGSKNFATVFEAHNPPSVASTSFFVLKNIDANVYSEYLAWFLNSPSTQTILKSKAKGTAIPSITKQALEELMLPLPTLEQQKTIVKIAKLQSKASELREKLNKLHQKKIEFQIITALNR